MRPLILKFLFASLLLAALSGCQRNPLETPTVAPAAMRDVAALRLNFRYEADVPAPPEEAKNAAEERNALVQANFDQTRPQELVDKTLVSPDKQKVLAVYHRADDAPSEFRLDMYSASGNLLKKITSDAMAAHFPDTIIWSPDSQNVAFVAVTRTGNTAPSTPSPDANSAINANVQTNSVNTNSANANAPNANTDANANAAPNTNAAVPTAPTPTAPTGVLTFRTEQIYLCDANGDGVKPLTQNEGLIYFYFVWSPDGAMLAALAATNREFLYFNGQAELKGEIFTPLGRPRLVEKTGRERRLDDGLTQVHPVWSPDSAKVALAFDRQIRVYDAVGNAPTQAAIPLRNQLLLSSQLFDRVLTQKMANTNGTNSANSANSANEANVNAETNQNTAANLLPAQTTLPEESTLVSFNPIINLDWTANEMLYFQTGYVKLMKNETDSARSYLRWHRLILSPQAISVK